MTNWENLNHHAIDAYAYIAEASRRKPRSPLSSSLSQPPIQEPAVSDLSLTILAFQIMSGVRVYSVSEYRADNSVGQTHRVKSRTELSPADSIIITEPQSSRFIVGRVLTEVTDFSYEEAVRYHWNLGRCANPQTELGEILRSETEATNKIAQTRAKKAALEILEASDLSFDEMKLLLEAKAE